MKRLTWVISSLCLTLSTGAFAESFSTDAGVPSDSGADANTASAPISDFEFDSLGVTATAATFVTLKKIPIMRATSDALRRPAIFSVFVDAAGNIGGMEVDGNEGIKTYNIEQIRKGFVVSKVKRGPFSRDIVRMRATQLDVRAGASITVTVLREYGVFSNDYRKFHIEIRRDGANWLANTNGQSGRKVFDTLHFVAKRSDGQAVGVETVRALNAGQLVDEMGTAHLAEN